MGSNVPANNSRITFGVHGSTVREASRQAFLDGLRFRARRGITTNGFALTVRPEPSRRALWEFDANQLLQFTRHHADDRNLHTNNLFNLLSVLCALLAGFLSYLFAL